MLVVPLVKRLLIGKAKEFHSIRFADSVKIKVIVLIENTQVSGMWKILFSIDRVPESIRDMGLRYVSELEEERKVKLARNYNNVCIGVVTTF